MGKRNRKRYGLYIEWDIWKRFDDVAYKTRNDVQPILHRAIEIGSDQALSEFGAPAGTNTMESQSPGDPSGHGTGGPLNVDVGTAILPEFRRWHWMLERVLESRNDEAIDTVQLNLRLLYRNIGGDPDHVDREISNSWKPGVRTDVVAESGGHPGSEGANQKTEAHNTKKRSGTARSGRTA